MTEAGATAETPEALAQKRDEPPRLIRVNWEYLSSRGCGCCAEWGEYGLKHAIVEFLDNIASGAYDDIPAPHLVFCAEKWQLTLKLRKYPDGAEYIAFGSPSGDVPPAVADGEVVHTSGSPMLLEYQLRRFAVNGNFKMLVVSFDSGRGLRIWKKFGGGYGIAGPGLSETEREWDLHTHS